MQVLQDAGLDLQSIQMGGKLETPLSIYCERGSDEVLDVKFPAKSTVLNDTQIEPDFRQKGIGSELLGIMIQYAKSRGATKLYAANPENAEWLTRKGFGPTEIQDNVWIMKDS